MDPSGGAVSWEDIYVSSWNTCGITDTGATYCWGEGSTLIQSSTTYTPTLVSGITLRDAAGNEGNMCGITTTDDLKCWGDNDSGAFGDGSTTDSSTPVQIMSDVAQVYGGERRTCAIKNNGSAYCWGKGGTYAAFGVGYVYSGDILNPTMVLSGEKWLKNVVTDAQILEKNQANNLSWTLPLDATGVVILRHSAPVTDKPSDGTTYVANNTVGSALAVVYAGTSTSFVDSGLTNDTTYYYSIHSYDSNNQYSNGVKVFGEPKRSENNQRISMHQFHTCALDHNNAPYCWGEGSRYEIGDGNTGDHNSPTAVDTSAMTGSKEFVHITTGNSYSCGITTDNNLWCWGRNASGEQGHGDTSTSQTPRKVDGSWRTTQAENMNLDYTNGIEHMCAIDTSGDLYCTGDNNDGQLGLGNTSAKTSLTKTLGGLKWKSIDGAALHTCGVTMEGEGFCWGSNADSKLGDGSSTGRYAPFSIQGDKLWKDVSLGKKNTCGITHDNKSYCWGDNSDHGELGNGTTTDSPIPVSTTGGHLFRQITSGEHIRCGVTTDDDLYCWGINSEGAVGNNTDGTPQHTPQFVMGDVYQVDAGRRSNCAVKNDGKGFCWGFSFIMKNWSGL